jgi:hypothetical protein
VHSPADSIETLARVVHDHGVKNLESPAVAQDKQRRKLAFLPPVWPLLVVVAVIVVITILVTR